MRRLAVAVVALCFGVLAVAATAGAAIAPVTWCGTAPSEVDRLPDAAGGFEWHVIYAFPSDGADRFGALASGIATDLASVDGWWNAQDPTRRIRFDLYAFPGCATGFGQLDLTRAQLPGPGSAYQALDGRLDRLIAELNSAPFAFVNPDKKYLVYFDGPVDDPNVCGQGNAGLVDGGRRAFALVFLQACGQSTPGDGDGVAAITAAHEMGHGFNALASPFPSPGPPHVCSPSDQGHPCDSELDLLYPEGTSSDLLSTRVLDVGRDDYYGHSGAWWDVQDSPFLVRVGEADTAPPAGPKSLRATSDGPLVTLSWPKAVDDVGPVRYRVYRDGALLDETATTSLRDRAVPGRILVYGVRAADAAGYLSPIVQVRFRVGVGVVDTQGALLQDTVAPPRVRGLIAWTRGSSLVLRWKATRDAGGIRGYLVEKNGARYRMVKRTSLSVPLPKAKGTWSVRAVDRAGNVGPRFQSVPRG
jgi:hypothetical protein